MLAIAGAIAALCSAFQEVEADDPEQNRFGCFLPDLTR